MAELEEQVSPCRPATPGPVLGKALVKGLCDNQRLQWEVSFELEPPALQRRDAQDADMWSETFHHLAARAIIRDFEQLAEREDEIELGESPGLRKGRYPLPEASPLAAQCPTHCPSPGPFLSKAPPTPQDPPSSAPSTAQDSPPQSSDSCPHPKVLKAFALGVPTASLG